MPKILGHRGMGAGYGENSLLSLVKAVQIGADGVETDVWLTKDSTMVLTHDPELEKVIGEKLNVKETSYKYLKKKCYINEELLTTLEMLYLELPDTSTINVELKDTDAASIAGQLVNSFGALERTIFSSFHHECLEVLKNNVSGAHIGLLIDERAKTDNPIEYFKELINRYNPYSLHLPVQMFEEVGLDEGIKLIDFLRQWEIRILLWTLNDPALALNVKDHCDYIVTDNISQLIAVFGGKA
ncbi:MAG: glycerophosphodiester phosphodiesterase [Kosmotoga sp.]|nr:MAG: glycerophosphodiester phosphodiesterase [Kosmotoga sp.]